MGEDISETYPGWRVFLDAEMNHQGKGIGEVLVSKSGQHYAVETKLMFNYINKSTNMKHAFLG